jgi:gliding motility-associated-like protein
MNDSTKKYLLIKFRLIILIWVVFFSCFHTFSQLSTISYPNNSDLIKNVLLGKGVYVSNIKCIGSMGYFDGSLSNIGLEKGVILSTGRIGNASGPNSTDRMTTELGLPGNAILSSLVGKNTADASLIEFDFIPYSDTIKFRYVFASEEYTEFVDNPKTSKDEGQGYNDVFGFFIEGPGFSNTTNIAKLPSGEPVTINNVNQYKNTNYFIENPVNTVQFDGFTKVLTAIAKVQCGKKYHLTLVIADCNDQKYDSAIFLEANSLNSEMDFDSKTTLSNDYFSALNTLAEGCSSASIEVIKQTSKDINAVIPIELKGSAQMNIDYSQIPNQITIPKGQTKAIFSFSALFDRVTDAKDSLLLILKYPDRCGTYFPDTIVFYFENIEPVEITLFDDTIRCKGNPIKLSPIVKGGIKPYSFLWSTNETSMSIFALPNLTSFYKVQVRDICYNEVVEKQAEVVVPVFKPLEIQLFDVVANEVNSFQDECPFVPKQLNVKASNGGGGYTYEWLNQDKLVSNLNSDFLKPSKTTTYDISVTDICGEKVTKKLIYTVKTPPLQTKMLGPTYVCLGDYAELKVFAEGGLGKYDYKWINSDSRVDTILIKPKSSRFYQVEVSDECKTFVKKDSLYVEVIRSKVQFKIEGKPIIFEDIKFINTSKSFTRYEWELDVLKKSTNTDETFVFEKSGVYDIKLIGWDSFGCKNDSVAQIKIYNPVSVYVPNVFTPDASSYNNTFFPVIESIAEIDFKIYNRWGELVFRSNDLYGSWDGTYSGENAPEDVYIYVVETTSILNEKDKFVGHVSLIRN